MQSTSGDGLWERMASLSRRAKTTGLLFGGGLMCFSCATLHGNRDRCEVVQRFPSMGTVFEIQLVISCTQPKPEALFVKIQKELNQMESEMSLYQTESAISELNRKGALKDAPKHLRTVLVAALDLSKKTNGAFDPSILPALEDIRSSFEKTQKPPADIKAYVSRNRSKVNYRQIQIKGNQIRFLRKGMKISLDGIAKGYAVDETVKELEQEGYLDYLVNFSGNMRWRGKSEKDRFWVIAVWNSIKKSALSLESTESGAIASSGAEFNYFSDDKHWHHIIDPRSLLPPRRYIETTAIGPSAMVCDGLSTAFFVMTPRRIRKTIAKEYSRYAFRLN